MLVGLAGSILQAVRLLELLYKGSKNKKP